MLASFDVLFEIASVFVNSIAVSAYSYGYWLKYPAELRAKWNRSYWAACLFQIGAKEMIKAFFLSIAIQLSFTIQVSLKQVSIFMWKGKTLYAPILILI